MKKFFVILILMLSVFSIATAHPFKSEKELNNFFAKIDMLIKEELKKDYREEMTKRKGTANNEYSFEIEDDRTVLITRSIAGIKPETKITQYFNSEGKLYMISSLTSETEKDLYALYRKYDSDGNLFIYSYVRNGKSAGSVFYKDGKIIKSTLVNSMKDSATFSLVTDINYNLNSNEIITDEFPNGLLKQYFIYNKNGLLDGESREYYEEGNIKSISSFKNNVANGLFISYYQNGNIKDKQNYKNGNGEGEGLFYYENGQLEEKYFMKNGKLDGEAINYFEDGKIRHKAIYKDGIILEEEVHENNEIQKNIFKNEEIVQQDIYTKNKILKATIFFLENEKTKIITYHKNGNKQEEVFSINGLLDGEAFIYYPSGKLENKSFFKDGKREGESLTYYENGKLKKKILYKNGMKNGIAIVYYENGMIEQKAYFVDDKKENERLYYDKKGNLIKTEIYKNNVKQ